MIFAMKSMFYSSVISCVACVSRGDFSSDSANSTQAVEWQVFSEILKVAEEKGSLIA